MPILQVFIWNRVHINIDAFLPASNGSNSNNTLFSEDYHPCLVTPPSDEFKKTYVNTTKYIIAYYINNIYVYINCIIRNRNEIKFVVPNPFDEIRWFFVKLLQLILLGDFFFFYIDVYSKQSSMDRKVIRPAHI